MSSWTLKRCRDCDDGGFLVEGKDWCFGATKNSPIRWHVANCTKKFEARGLAIHKEVIAERKAVTA